jgi:hypothetical protein
MGGVTHRATGTAWLKRERLGDHLAEHDVQVGDGDDRQHHGQAMGRDQGAELGDPERQQPALDEDGEGVLAVHAQAQAREGDPELCGRHIAIEAGRVVQVAAIRPASLSPASARAAITARGAPTIANSAATKSPLSATRTRMTTRTIASSSIDASRCRAGIHASTESIAAPSIRSISKHSPPAWRQQGPRESHRAARSASPRGSRRCSAPRVGPLGLCPRLGLVEGQTPGHRQRPSGSLRRGRIAARLVLVGELAQQLTDDVLQAHEPSTSPYSSTSSAMRARRSRISARARSTVSELGRMSRGASGSARSARSPPAASATATSLTWR